MLAIILGSLALFVETRLSEKDVANPPGGFRPSWTTTNTTASMNSKNKSQFLQDNERERERVKYDSSPRLLLKAQNELGSG